MDADEIMTRARRIAERRGGRLGLTPADIDDVLQEVVTRAWTAWEVELPRNPDAWLQRAVNNAVVDHLRADGRRPADRFGDADDDPLTRAIAAFQSTQYTSEGALQREVVERVFRLVEAEEADLLRARYLDNRSAREVAEELAISPAAVDQRTARARRALREALEDRPDLLDALWQPHPHVYDARPPRRQDVRRPERGPAPRGTTP